MRFLNLQTPRLVILFFRLSAHRKRFILLAVFYLLAARIALKIVPYKKIAHYIGRPFHPRNLYVNGIEKLENEVVWAIDTAAKYLPGKTVCFPRALAAQEILRNCGVPTTLYYGARSDAEQGLETHVWLQNGAKGIVGFDGSRRYKVLAHYP